MIIVESREFDDPEIAKNHGIKIESRKIAEAESADGEKKRSQGERSNIQRGRVSAGLVEHDDFECCIEICDVDQRHATDGDMEVDKEGWPEPEARPRRDGLRDIVRQVGHLVLSKDVGSTKPGSK